VEGSPGAWRATGVWVVLGLVVFIAWQVVLARSVQRPRPMVS